MDHALSPDNFCRKSFDWISFFLAIFMIAGQCFLLKLAVFNELSILQIIILATFLMNLSFTVWHEATHGNYARSLFINNLIGIFGSLFSLYPGYFSRRREHLAHHRWEGDEKNDPVYPRIQCSVMKFPFRLIQTIAIKKDAIPKEFMPLTQTQKMVDGITLGAVLVFFLVFCLEGNGWAFFNVFILPRGVIFWLHAFYICYFPHAAKNGRGFERYRIISAPWFWRWFTLGQTNHGIHHRWPYIPWHAYHRFRSYVNF